MKASPNKTSFNAGEISPLLYGRVDIAKYQNGAFQCRNFIPTVQGPARRRPGTRYIASAKDSAAKAWLSKFEFNTSQAYVLEWGNNYIRFYTQEGQLQSFGFGPLEVATPYSTADLTTTDGTFALDMVQSGDVLYVVHPSYPPYKLQRFANTNWTFTKVDFTNGPFKAQNTDKTLTVYASTTTGSVTLKASAAVFTAAMVGQIIRLDPVDYSTIKPWGAGQEIAHNGDVTLGILRRSNGKTYSCATNISIGAGNALQCGGESPTHDYGTQSDGSGLPVAGTVVQQQGVDWTYVDSGWGYLEITAYTSSTQVTATVKGSNLPKSVCLTAQTGTTGAGSAVITGLNNTDNLSVGMSVTASTIPGGRTIASIDSHTQITISSGAGVTGSTVTISFIQPTFRWSLGAFNATDGYPSAVTFFRERLTFAAGQKVYFSGAGDFENFAAYNSSGNATAAQAIQVTLSSDQVDSVQWLAPQQALIIGTAGAEFACGENSTNDVFGPGNVKIEQHSTDGSRSVKPVRVGNATLFVQRSGKKLKELTFQLQANAYRTADMTVLAEHVTKDYGITQLAWHKEPYVALWSVREDGALLGFTYNTEQDVTGWHVHSIGPDFNGFGNQLVKVESIAVIPTVDKLSDQLWMIVRTDDAARWVLMMETESSGVYVDAGLSYNSTPATTISGLGHLDLTYWAGTSGIESNWLGVLADGAVPTTTIKTSSSIGLSRAASVVYVGFNYQSYLTPTAFEAGAADGTSQGKYRRTNKVAVRFNEVQCGQWKGIGSVNWNQFLYPKSAVGGTPTAMRMDTAPTKFTGVITLDWEGNYVLEDTITIRQSAPFPMTVCAIMPQQTVYDR